MRRLLDFIFGRRGRVIDLPEQFGRRCRMAEVRDAFKDPRQAEMIRVVAQLLWMARTVAAEEAMDAAVDGKTVAGFHLGQMAAIDNALADFDKLMKAKDGAELPLRMRAWFLE